MRTSRRPGRGRGAVQGLAREHTGQTVAKRKIAAAPRVPSPARPHNPDLAGAIVDRGQQNSVDHLGCRVIAVGRRINCDSRHGFAMGGSKRLRLAWPSHARRVGARGYDPVRRMPAVRARLACSACWGAGRRRPLWNNPIVRVMGCYRPIGVTRTAALKQPSARSGARAHRRKPRVIAKTQMSKILTVVSVMQPRLNAEPLIFIGIQAPGG